VSSEAVDLFVTDNTPQTAPIPGVTVKVTSQDGTILYTQDTTDSNGHLALLLPTEMSPYQVRMFKAGWQLKNPQILQVVSGGPNAFNFTGVGVTPPIPTDARLCTAYGFFRDITGAPARNVRIYFISLFKPFILDGAGVMTERVEAVTDDNGYAQINLVRNAQYDVTVSGTEDYTRNISVPDQPNVNLPDLLFPVVSAITFSPVIPESISVGDPDLVVTPTVYTSDGNILPYFGSSDVQWSSSDDSVLAVLPAGGVLTLRGLKPGTAQLIAKRSDTSIVRYPDPGIMGIPTALVVL
jgi:hypothetical protein